MRAARPPEILAPAGGHPQLAAAIEAGADAVYFGLTRFNARARAANFESDELPGIMRRLHERGVMGFVTVNTLVFDEELEEASELLRWLAECKVDAAIVQDLGLAALARRVAPDLPLHGSTQMTVTSAESARLVQRLGVERVVLGRELSVREIREVIAGTDLEVEVFVHGALCVSYSGQCFSSEAWGGRSANRGQCAQACRLPYDLVVDGQVRDLGDVAYLLSPQDLAGVQHVPALVEAGVSCFKIEGRLKGPEYVAATTAAYRAAVDAAWAGRPHVVSVADADALGQVFSRGLSPGFLDGPKHQLLVEGRSPRHRGLLVGEVLGVTDRGVIVAAVGPCKAGDGVVFDAGRPEVPEVGGAVYVVLRDGEVLGAEAREGRLELRFGPRMSLSAVRPGQRVWRTLDPALLARLRSTWEEGIRRREPVDAELHGALGGPLTLTLRDGAGREGSAQSGSPLQSARQHGLDLDTVRAQIERLGDTPLELRALSLDVPAGCFLPVRELNELRRTAAEDLLALRREEPVRRDVVTPPPFLGLFPTPRRVPSLPPASPVLSLLCRSPEQVQAALGLPGVEEILVDFLEVKGLGAAIAAVQAAGKRAVAVSPRVLKPSEERIRAFLKKLGADAILVRSLGLLESLASEPDGLPELHGDFSLNCTNQETLALLLDAGLTRLAPGHDLNEVQLCALAHGGDAASLELIVHHHLPIFHTEHCVFARFLSDGNSRRDCGAPCEHHEVHVQGRDGQRHLVRADMGCRNTVFNAEAQSGLRGLPAFLRAGYRRFRLELSDHGAEEVAPLVALYVRALAGAVAPVDAFRDLRAAERRGVTVGSLRVLEEPERGKAPGWMARRG